VPSPPNDRPARPPSPSRASAIQAELLQTRPFPSIYQEATVALMRTTAMLRRAVSRVIETTGISMAQYNVLRILRGAGSDGLPTLAIRARLIEEAPGITRLVEKLEQARLIRRDRSTPDRRQVVCRITDEGLTLLAGLDEAVDEVERQLLSPLTSADTEQLLALLDRIRRDRGDAR
jgi:DNA-binding MarR family transcriptional regulator